MEFWLCSGDNGGSFLLVNREADSDNTLKIIKKITLKNNCNITFGFGGSVDNVKFTVQYDIIK